MEGPRHFPFNGRVALAGERVNGKGNHTPKSGNSSRTLYRLGAVLQWAYASYSALQSFGFARCALAFDSTHVLSRNRFPLSGDMLRMRSLRSKRSDLGPPIIGGRHA